MANELLVLDGLSLNDNTTFALEALDMTPPRKRHQWVSGADADGSALVRDPLFENREIVATVRIVPQASMDLALDKIGLVVDKLEEAERQPDGLALVWTPADSSVSLTFYVLSGEVDGLPISRGSGWLVRSPLLTVRLVCKPFGYGAEVGNVTDTFATDTIGNYTFDAGAGTLSVSGGQLVPSSTTEKVLYYSAREFSDVQLTLKITTGSSVTGGNKTVGLTARRQDASNYLMGNVVVNGASSQLALYEIDGGSFNNLVASATFTTAVSTNYWLRFRLVGNVLVVEWFTAAPTVTSVPAQSITHTLVGGDATEFGVGVSGEVGIRTDQIPTDYRYDDFSIEPNVWRGSDPVLTGFIAGVPGDVPAEGRLIVTDTASQNRRHVEWGLENRYMNSALSLIVDSDSMVTTGFTGTQTTRTGAYDPNASGNNVISATLTGEPVAVCGTGDLSHVGSFRVKARVWASSPDVRVRLSWQDGDGSFTPNAYATPPVEDAFSEIDLGVINVAPAALGTQRWTGRVEAYSATTGDTVEVDSLWLVPAGEGYGLARGAYAFVAGSLVARDEFTGTTAGGALNARAAPTGGSWATSGSATDFAFADDFSGEQIKRSTVSDASSRWAILGTTNYTDTQVEADIAVSALPINGQLYAGVVARWTDSSNNARAAIYAGAPGGVGTAFFQVAQTVAGVVTVFERFTIPGFVLSSYYRVRLIVYPSGRAVAQIANTVGGVLATISGQSTALATGGALASGEPGLVDLNPASTAVSRWYDNFAAYTPAPEPIALYSAQSLEVRHDTVLREDSTGTYWGPPPSYRGSRFVVPAAGDENRTSRVAVKARRNDVAEDEDANIADALQVQAILTPRWLVAPR